MSCPHQLCSAVVAHACGFFNGIISYLVSLLLMPLPPQHYCLFQRILPFHDVPKEAHFNFVIFASIDVSGLICYGTHLLIFCTQGIFRAILQHHISNKSIFFLSVFFTVHFSHPYIVIGNKRVNDHPNLGP